MGGKDGKVRGDGAKERGSICSQWKVQREKKGQNNSIPPPWPCPAFSHSCCHMPALTHQPQHPHTTQPWALSLLLGKHAVWICAEQFMAAIKHMCMSYNKL